MHPAHLQQAITPTLPDASQHLFAATRSVAEVAAAIEPGLANDTIAGKLPTWLAAVQAIVLSIMEDHAACVQDVAQQLRGAVLRVESDLHKNAA